MADIRLKTITVDSSPLIIKNGSVLISDTTPSSGPDTGSLVSYGGISVNNTKNTFSYLDGGALSVAGGVSIMKNLYVGNNLVLDNITSNFRIHGALIDRMYIDSESFFVSLNGIQKILELQNNYLNIDITTVSSNLSTGAVVVTGSVNINSTENTSNISSGGALTVAGGASIAKSLFVGEGIFSTNANTIGNLFTTTNGNVGIGTSNPTTKLAITPNSFEPKITLYQTDSNSHTGFGVSDNQLNYHIHNTSGSHIFYAGGINGGGNELMRITGTGNVGIGTSNPLHNLDVNGTISFGMTINSSGNLINNESPFGKTFTTNTQMLIKRLKTDYTITETCLSEWFTRKSISSKIFNNIDYSSSLNIFVAVGNGGIIFYSNDGINWIESYYSDTSVSLYGISWSPELKIFVAIGYTSGISARILTSSDGISWTLRTSSITNAALKKITWSADLGLFVAIADGYIITSVNGINWNTATGITNTSILRDISWSSELNTFVVVGENTIVYSKNGTSWLEISSTNDLNSICWSDILSTFVASGDGIVISSFDGINWSTSYTNSDFEFKHTIWSSELTSFVSIVYNSSDSSYNIFASPDANTWSLVYLIPFNAYSIYWNNEFSVFFCVGNENITTSRIALPSTRSILLTNRAYMFVDISTGNVGIKTTQPAYDLHVNGNMYASNITCDNIVITGSVSSANVYANNYTGNNVYISNISSSSIISENISTTNLAVTNVTSQNLRSINITSTNVYITEDINCNTLISDKIISTGNNHTLGNISIKNGLIGVNNTDPQYTLDINGNLNLNGGLSINGTVTSSNSSTGSLVVQGGVSIASTQNSTSVSSGGALTIAGGVAISKSLYVGGNVRFMNTEPSTGDSNSSVYVRGGVTIDNTQNATSRTAGGALSIAGGASILGDLYVGGQIYNTSLSQSVFNNLNIIGTLPSSNFSTGTILTQGGITILSSANSTSISNGGALLVKGGASIGRDMYIGGTQFVYDKTQYIRNTPVIATKNSHLIFSNQNGSSLFSFDTQTDNLLLSRYSSGNFIDSPMYISNNGQVVLPSTRSGTGISSASILISGSVSILSTQSASIPTSTGALIVNGGVNISKNLIVNGDVEFTSTTESPSINYGALLINGGVGIQKNLNVGGNLSVLGDLYVRGNTTFIETTNAIIEDNIILLNSAPSGSRDAGILIERYQTSNNDSAGDVVNETPKTNITLSSQSSGLSSTQIQFPITGISYKNWWIKITSGVALGAVRKIIEHDLVTGIVTLDSALTTKPVLNDTISLYNRPFVGFVFNEILNRFEFGSTLEDTTTGNFVSFDEYVPIACSSLTVTDTQVSINATTGAMIINGGISINNTQNAVSVSSGGSFTTLGGGSFAKDVYIGGSLFVKGTNITPHPEDIYNSSTLGGLNNITNQAFTGLAFTNNVWGFDVHVSVKLILTDNGIDTNYAAFYNLRAINKENSWEITQTYVGDDLQINFGIQTDVSNDAQITYSTPDYNSDDFDFKNLTFKWRAFAV